MKGFWRRSSLFPAFALASAIPAFAGTITYSCSDANSNFAADGPAGLCNYLNTVIAPLYDNTFSNANANIYIEFSNNDGLADSSTGFFNRVSYSVYETALQAESTDAARNTLPVSEPSIFGGDSVNLTSSLAEALGITTNIDGDPILGITEGTNAANGSINGTSCTTFATAGSGCYNGIIQMNIPADLDSQLDQGYTYRSLGGSTTGTTENYDFFSTVEHETDEILGTASCVDTTADNNTALSNPGNCASAVDLFRYTCLGTITAGVCPDPARTFDTTGTSAYFSANGGATDYDGNQYNDQANGNDWADFNTNCLFVQDGTGCLNPTAAVDITNDFHGSPGPEIGILNAVGFDLSTVAPEPGTLGMLGFGFTALGFMAYRRRRATPLES